MTVPLLHQHLCGRETLRRLRSWSQSSVENVVLCAKVFFTASISKFVTSATLLLFYVLNMFFFFEEFSLTVKIWVVQVLMVI